MAPEGTYKMEHHPRTWSFVRLGLGMFRRSFHTASPPETATGTWLEKCHGGDSPWTQPAPPAPGASHGLPQQGEGLGWVGPRRSWPWCEGMAETTRQHSDGVYWPQLIKARVAFLHKETTCQQGTGSGFPPCTMAGGCRQRNISQVWGGFLQKEHVFGSEVCKHIGTKRLRREIWYYFLARSWRWGCLRA